MKHGFISDMYMLREHCDDTQHGIIRKKDRG